MGTLKPYRFKLAWQNYRVGAVITPSGVTRDWLVANGYVEPVPDAPPPQAPAAERPEPAVTGAPAPAPQPTGPTFVRKPKRGYP